MEWMNRMKKMVLLVVDTQKGITDERLYRFEEFRDNVKSLIAEARRDKVEVIFVRHDDGPGSGFSVGDEDFEIYDGFAPEKGELIFDKSVNSAFHPSTGLLQYLEMKQVKKAIVVGLQTDFCIDATIKSGFENGFEIIVPEYSNSTRDNQYMDAETSYEFFNSFIWPNRYARCVSLDETLELLRSYKKNCDNNEKEELLGEKEKINGGYVNPCGTLEIETDRLTLRQFRYEDADSMMKNWAGLDEVQNMYGEPSYKTPEAVKGLLDEYIGAYKNGFKYRWAIIEKASGECVGQVAYFLVDVSGHFGEIEYCIGTAFQGKGYATEATKAVIDFGFNEIHFHKVQICVRPSNVSSKRVIEKCDFEYEGTLRDYFLIDGEYEGRMYYSIINKQ